MTTSQAQKTYKVDGSTLRDRLMRGTLKGYKIDDNEQSPWLILIEDLDKNYKKRS